MRAVLVYAAALALLLIPCSASATGIGLVVGDILLSDLPDPYFSDAKMMVPVEVIYYLGGEIETISNTESQFLIADKSVSVRAGSDKATINGVVKSMDVPAEGKSGTVFIPLRLLSEELRLCNVVWEQTSSTIRLSSRLPNQRVEVPPLKPKVSSEVATEIATEVANRSVGESVKPPTLTPSPQIKPAKQMAWEWLGTKDAKILAEATSTADDFVLTLQGVSMQQVQATCTSEPAKVILDIAEFEVTDGQTPTLFAHPLVRTVRIANYKGQARLVFDLNELVGYQVEPVENGIVVRLNRALHQLTVIASSAGGQLYIDLPDKTPYRISRLVQPDRVVIDLLQTTLIGGSQTQTLDEGPLQALRVSQFNNQVTRLVLDVDANYQSTPYQLSSDRLTFLLHTEIEQVGLARLDNDVNAVFIKGYGFFNSNVIRQHDPERLIIDLMNAQSEYTFANQVITDSPINRIQAEQFAPGVFRVVMDMAGKTNYRVLELPDGGGVAVLISPVAVKGARIALDAGHGGTDPGAVGPGGLLEKEVNLDITKRLSELLTANGAQVYNTRTGDVYIEPAVRRTMLNSYDPDIIVSIHANATLDHTSRASGTETWYMNEDDRDFAIVIQSELVSSIGTYNRGVKQGQYAVLRDARAPAVLVEVAFISQIPDEQLLRDEKFRQMAAQGIYKGIARWLEPTPIVADEKLAGDPLQLWTMIMENNARSLLAAEKKPSADSELAQTRTSESYEVSLVPNTM